MPPKIKVNKSDILQAALTLVRKYGAAALNARTLAEQLQTSTQPIFSNYTSMEVLRKEVIAAANHLYNKWQKQEMERGYYPAYKASGMAYIRFAAEERELFKLLFMRDRSEEEHIESTEEIEPILQILCQNTGLSHDGALYFHMEMWAFVHGIAAMMATNYYKIDLETISNMLTDVYLGLRARFCTGTTEIKEENQ